MKFMTVIIFIILLANPFSCLWEEFAGAYYLRWKSLGECRNTGKNRIRTPTKLYRVNRTHKAYRNNVTFPFDLTNEYELDVVVHTKGTNGYTWNILLDIARPFCDFISAYSRVFVSEVFASSGYTFECPIKKGNYVINYPIPDIYCNVFPAVPVFPYGDCRIEISLHSGKGETYVREGCMAIFFESRPLYEVRGGCPKRI